MSQIITAVLLTLLWCVRMSIKWSRKWCFEENLLLKSASSVPVFIYRQESEKWKWKSLSHVQLFGTPWNAPGQNTGVRSLSLLQGIFPTQGSNPGLSHCRQILYKLSHKGSPIILEWVAYPFSSGSSWPRNRTRVSCIAGRFFTNWAMREALWEPSKESEDPQKWPGSFYIF